MRYLWLIIAALGTAVTLSSCGGGSGVDPLEVGDPERGREIFITGGGVIPIGRCSLCHSLGDTVATGAYDSAPSLLGIAGRAADRVPELSAVEYLRQSIEDPSAYIVEGFSDTMFQGYRVALSEEDINSLIAFMLTLPQ